MSPLLGHPIPAFSLQDDQGTTVTAKDFKGHWTVLYAYPKDSTPGCTTEACDFRDNLARVQSLGAQVYGISRDSLKSHTNFIAKQNLPFRLLSDPDTALLKALGAFGKKMMYGKEVEGIIRSTFLVDPKGIIRHVWPKVSVKGHVAEVIEILAGLSK
ncbi:peroxiredoxin [Geothrix limicola]|uniref:thioredoxin-dependent peroxiredoxin n=1 Tax=Geothrix limicola TaxID=2927978 RepID=A0ABQ5QA36_9BACT|nr:peroxiredoxin [Geothrix limicola]GLH71543.1 peroxiredoxin [Geothrix limicola]